MFIEKQEQNRRAWNNKTSTAKSGLTNAPKKANNAKPSRLPDGNENKALVDILRLAQRRLEGFFEELGDWQCAR